MLKAANLPSLGTYGLVEELFMQYNNNQIIPSCYDGETIFWVLVDMYT